MYEINSEITELNDDTPDLTEFEWNEGRPQRLRWYFAAKRLREEEKVLQRQLEYEMKCLEYERIIQAAYKREQIKSIGESYYYSDAYLEDIYV